LPAVSVVAGGASKTQQQLEFLKHTVKQIESPSPARQMLNTRLFANALPDPLLAPTISSAQTPEGF
jgi:hypothetical protein